MRILSTDFTTYSPLAGYRLVDSRSLKLMRAVADFQSRVMAWLLDRLHRDGFEGLTASQLSFLGQLDCGANHAAALARGLGISRQAVHKTVSELATKGWLTMHADTQYRNQKVIQFTAAGERMMARARMHFRELDDIIEAAGGAGAIASIERVLAIALASGTPSR